MLLITLLKGIAVGIVIALPVGPVGVLCVRRCLLEGPRYGLASGLGAALADATFGAMAGFGFTYARAWLLAYQDWFGLVGGIFLLAFGGKALFTNPARAPVPLGDEALAGAFASTFALTIANPITLLAFAAIFAKVGAQAVTGLGDVSVLVGGVFLGSMIWWIGLAVGIGAVRQLADELVLRWVNRLSAAILLSGGAGLVIVALRGLAAAMN